MTVKLADKTVLTVSHEDVAQILSDHFCSSSYDTFALLRVADVSEGTEGDFQITMLPKPELESAA